MSKLEPESSMKWRVLFTLLLLLTFLLLVEKVPLVYRWIVPQEPVVKDFQLLYNHRTGNIVTIQGTLNKTRDCLFRELSAYDIRDGEPSTPLSLNLSFDNIPKSRLTGFQNWGPWDITLLDSKPTKILLRTRHLCNDEITVYTTLTTFSVVGDQIKLLP